MGGGFALPLWVILQPCINPQRGNHYHHTPVQTLESNDR